MDKETFIELMENNERYEDLIDMLEDNHITIVDSVLFEFTSNIFSEYLNAIFNEDGVDWIFWFLFDKNGDPDLKAYDKDDNEIKLETYEDLWNLVEPCLKVKPAE